MSDPYRTAAPKVPCDRCRKLECVNCPVCKDCACPNHGTEGVMTHTHYQALQKLKDKADG